MVIRFPSTTRIHVVKTGFQLLYIFTMAFRNSIVAVDCRSISIGNCIVTMDIPIRGVISFIVVDSTISMGLNKQKFVIQKYMKMGRSVLNNTIEA